MFNLANSHLDNMKLTVGLSTTPLSQLLLFEYLRYADCDCYPYLLK